MEIGFIDDSVNDFIESLELQTGAKVFRALDMLEKFGHRLGMPHSKKIDGSIFELRVIGKQNIRLLYVFHAGEALILHCFIKKTRKMPMRELRTALAKYNNLI